MTGCCTLEKTAAPTMHALRLRKEIQGLLQKK